MKALILNSGIGRRMGEQTGNQPKCMTPLITGETILSRQLAQLSAAGIEDIVITTGPFENLLIKHAKDSAPGSCLHFVNNPLYYETNYIYSIYLARSFLDDDLLLIHGDLVFDEVVLASVLAQKKSVMAVSSTTPLPEKDFKAVIQNHQIAAVGIKFFDNALAAQPLYRLLHSDWSVWLNTIIEFIDSGERNCYAENALNQVTDRISLSPFDVGSQLCNEIDTFEDLQRINSLILKEAK